MVGYGGNPNNIFNYFRNKILNGDTVNIQNVSRTLIDIDDVGSICKYCFNLNNKVINISNIEILKVNEIVDIISDVINIKVQKNIISGGFDIKTQNSVEVENAINYIGIDRTEYTKNLIEKYIKNGKYKG